MNNFVAYRPCFIVVYYERENFQKYKNEIGVFFLKKLLMCFLSLAILISSSATAMGTADRIIQPYYNNATTANANFTINTSGKAVVSLFCHGTPGVMTGVTVKTYIEKKSFIFFWTRVDIGQPNDEWTDTASGSSFAKEHSVQLTDKGTYRAVVKFTVSGTGGPADAIPFTLEDSY